MFANTWRLAWQLLLRDWKSGELKVLVLSLLIAVASVTSIGVFNHRIERSMTDQAGLFLGADLILKSSQFINRQFKYKAEELKLNTSSATSFSTVIVANDEFQLAYIKAVDGHYPLLNSIKISDTPYGNETSVNNGPAVGEVWLAPRLFSALKLQLNDTIELGMLKLRVTAVLKHDPGQTTSMVAIAPRALMNHRDVVATGIIQPGSRVTYLQMYSGALQNRQAFENWLTPQLNKTQKLLGGSENSEAVSSAMDKARQYLALASMLSVLLTGIAIATAANRYGYRHFDQAAIMRCIGATQKTILQIFTIQLFIVGTLASLAGVITGYIAQHGLAMLLQGLLVNALPPAGPYPLLVGFISGFITLCGFSLPAMIRLRRVSPLRVLRHDITPLPVKAWLSYIIAIASIILLMWWQSGELALTVSVLAGVLTSIFVLFILSRLILMISKALVPVFTGPVKSGIQQLLRQRKANEIQILAFGLSLLILLSIYLVRTDLLDRWQAKLPDNSPNHFVINIQPYEVNDVKQYIQQNNIQTEGLYPMVRGRITHINAIPVLDAIPDQSKLDEALKRELNLSWANALQANNSLVKGDWWRDDDTGKALISLEQGLARRLDVGLGDSLSFQIADQTITATIRSIRKVQWDSFQPNFYVIFPEKVIETYPVSYISSFYLAPEEKKILNPLIKRFPTLTVLEIDDLMNQVRQIMDQASTAIEYVMLFVLLAGSMVLIASMQASMDQRYRAAIIMRTLGASKQYLRSSLLTEFSFLGLFAGLLAITGTEIIAALLYNKVFDLEFVPHYGLWITAPAISVVLILFISWFYMRHIPNQPPVKILRYTG